MRKKSEAQIFLEQVEKLDARITNKLIEKQQWKEIAMGITASMDGERVQSSGAKSKMANAVERLVDAEAEIDSLVDELIDTKKKVIQTIERLDSAFEYTILHKKFIQYKTLEMIADEMNKSYTSITTAHGRALVNVQRILDERRECNAEGQ